MLIEDRGIVYDAMHAFVLCLLGLECSVSLSFQASLLICYLIVSSCIEVENIYQFFVIDKALAKACPSGEVTAILTKTMSAKSLSLYCVFS